MLRAKSAPRPHMPTFMMTAVPLPGVKSSSLTKEPSSLTIEDLPAIRSKVQWSHDYHMTCTVITWPSHDLHVTPLIIRPCCCCQYITPSFSILGEFSLLPVQEEPLSHEGGCQLPSPGADGRVLHSIQDAKDTLHEDRRGIWIQPLWLFHMPQPPPLEHLEQREIPHRCHCTRGLHPMINYSANNLCMKSYFSIIPTMCNYYKMIIIHSLLFIQQYTYIQ